MNHQSMLHSVVENKASVDNPCDTVVFNWTCQLLLILVTQRSCTDPSPAARLLLLDLLLCLFPPVVPLPELSNGVACHVSKGRQGIHRQGLRQSQKGETVSLRKSGRSSCFYDGPYSLSFQLLAHITDVSGCSLWGTTKPSLDLQIVHLKDPAATWC